MAGRGREPGGRASAPLVPGPSLSECHICNENQKHQKHWPFLAHHTTTTQTAHPVSRHSTQHPACPHDVTKWPWPGCAYFREPKRHTGQRFFTTVLARGTRSGWSRRRAEDCAPYQPIRERWGGHSVASRACLANRNSSGQITTCFNQDREAAKKEKAARAKPDAKQREKRTPPEDRSGGNSPDARTASRGCRGLEQSGKP